MEKKMHMDEFQISAMITENEALYQAERSKGGYFEDVNYKTPKHTVTKEPEISLVSHATYPRKYLEAMLEMAKKTNGLYITLEMGKKQAPLKLSFFSEDKYCLDDKGIPTNQKTSFWLAPRIDDDIKDEPEEKTADEAIQEILEDNIKLQALMKKLQDERSAVLDAAAKQRERDNK